MKKIIYLIISSALALISINLAFGQQTSVKVRGHVLNIATENPVPNQSVIIMTDSMLNSSYFKKVVTDQNGFYSDTIPIHQLSAMGNILVYTFDCHGARVIGTGIVQLNVPEVNIELRICSGQLNSCDASFTYQKVTDDLLTLVFNHASVTEAGTNDVEQTWDFGDGITTKEMNPIHTYAKAGLYRVCLLVRSSDSICMTLNCMDVTVGNPIPPQCSNDFTYFIDSIGKSYVFSGISKYSNANSWHWDFGDGTTASGQTVAHVFQDVSATHKVCLTTLSSSTDSMSCKSVSCQDVYMYFPSPCESSFSYQQDSLSSAFKFQGWAKNSNISSWEWDFGDSITASGKIVSHVFTNPNTSYKICLKTSAIDAAGNVCVSESCQDLYIYKPSPCESSFGFHQDSTGTVYTFQGWAKNNRINYWTWDFGDGTSASGQTVSHVFSNANSSFNVCLTTSASGIAGTECTSKSCQEVFILKPSQCDNEFKFLTSDNKTYTFSGQLISGVATGNYYWDFGDGETAKGQLVTHTYKNTSIAPINKVCLTTSIGDSNLNTGCSSTSCQFLFPSRDSLCKASMSVIPDNTGLNFKFENLSTGNPSFTLWNFGDGDKSVESNTSHSYAAAGIYYVCLSIGDSLSQCYDQICQEIWVGVIKPECNASFFVLPADTIGATTGMVFFNNSLPGYSKQLWLFGDGTESSEFNPIHVYQAPGIYNVCLTIGDSTGNCKNSSCSDIIVGEIKGNNQISGILQTGNAVPNTGMVWLIGVNNLFHSEIRTDSTGIFIFQQVPNDKYYVYGMLTPDSHEFFKYLPTYYNGALTWLDATVVDASSPNAWYTINLLPTTVWEKGNAEISGNINWQSSSKSKYTPAEGIEIVLYNSSGEPITYTFSDSDGAFHFSNLPYGDYTVKAEMMGKTPENIAISLTKNYTNVNVGFAINDAAISSVVLAVNEKPLLKAGNPYPNPVSETLSILLNGEASGTVTAEIIDLTGRTIRSEVKALTGGFNELSLSTGNLQKGMYLLRIKPQGHQAIERKFIR